jgi:sarcosine oxidase subunit alpha
MSGWRLPQGGRLIQRNRVLGFQFEGRAFQGFQGDTLASALLAQGQGLLARSFKYHRPRGLLAAGWEDPCAFVELRSPRTEPSVLATTEPLVEGLQAWGQHGWPSLRLDLLALFDGLSAWLPAGFYYKAFKSPAWAWPWFERALRHAAGLGRMPDEPPAASQHGYERRFAHADVLVVGAGVAGLWAAHALGQTGVRVILADDAPQPGGRWLDRPVGSVMDAWIDHTVQALDALPNVRRWPMTQVVSRYDHGLWMAIDRSRPGRERLWKIRASHALLATGQIERPLLFADNDRPGIMLASAVSRYLHRWGVAAGRRMVLATNNDAAWSSAFEAHKAGIKVQAVADLRTQVHSDLLERARALGLRVELGARPVSVRGRQAVREVTVDLASGQRQCFEADVLAVSGGWTSALALHAQGGGRSRYDTTLHGMVPDGASTQALSVGAATGVQSTPAVLASAAQGAEQVALALGLRLPKAIGPDLPAEPCGCSAIELKGLSRGRVFVDGASDVTLDDLRLAQQEGYEATEHLKRYTALGMGPDQGRLSALNGAVLMAQLRGLSPGDLGPTRLRPPYTPLPFGAIAGVDPGPLIRPVRRTPITDWHERQGAVMYESGQNWRRPGYYPRAGESLPQTLEREVRACRETVALYDSSPLGKFEISGPQAIDLLEHMYTCRVSDLSPGRGRYAVMLREDGRIFDDGTVFCVEPQRWWVTTTSGQPQAVHAALESALQVHFKGQLEAFVTPVTDQWAALVVCGPLARELLQACGCNLDLSRSAFPFMTLREAELGGFAVRMFRVSFTGELSFELHVPARRALALWTLLLDKGKPLGLAVIGSEANHVLRVEKGFISVGHEVDGCVNPLDLGLAWAVRMDKNDFVGKRSLQRDLARPQGRPQLVGLLVEAGEVPLEEGAQILKVDLDMDPQSARALDQASAGFVTASVFSPSLQRAVALALLEDGAARHGQMLWVTAMAPSGLTRRPARVVPPVFVDPQGGRMRG